MMMMMMIHCCHAAKLLNVIQNLVKTINSANIQSLRKNFGKSNGRTKMKRISFFGSRRLGAFCLPTDVIQNVSVKSSNPKENTVRLDTRARTKF